MKLFLYHYIQFTRGILKEFWCRKLQITSSMSRYCNIKDTLKAFGDFENKQKSVWSNVFWHVKVCIFWKCIQYNKHQEKTQMLKSFLWKHHSFTFNSWFSYELKHKVRLSKIVCGIFHFRFRFVFIKVCIFVQQNAWTLWF